MSNLVILNVIDILIKKHIDKLKKNTNIEFYQKKNTREVFTNIFTTNSEYDPRIKRYQNVTTKTSITFTIRSLLP